MEDLRQCRKDLQVFHQSKGYEIFKSEYESAKEMAISTLTTMAPEGIKDLILREQAVGQLEQIQTALIFFESKEEEIQSILTNEK